jgi:hypothetical protein
MSDPAPKRRWFTFELIVVIGAIATGALLVSSVRQVLHGIPKWVLIAENQDGALRVRMVTTESDQPVYEVLVLGGHLPTAPLRLPITEAEGPKANGVTTLFTDHTYGPGRWVFTIDGVHFDCQESRISVDGTEHSPPAKVTVNPSEEPVYIPPHWY